MENKIFDYFIIPDSDDFQFGEQPFEIEFISHGIVIGKIIGPFNKND